MSRNPAAKPTILVIDDEPQVAAALSDLLEGDYEVICETAASSALEILEGDPDISVVLCDQRMPNITGDKVLARAGEVSSATRILITGFADLQAVIDAVNEGKIFGYISKPWDSEALQLAVHKAVEFNILTRELHEEQRLLRSLMDHSPDSIYFKDRDQRFLRVNGVAACMIGVARPEDAIGKRIEDFVPPEIAARIAEEEGRILEAGEPVLDIERKGQWVGDASQWFSTSKAAMRDEHDEIVGLFAVNRDITERKRANNKLAESEKLLRLVLDSTTEGIFGVDHEGKCMFCNKACLNFLGYVSADDIRGQDMHDLLHPSHVRPDGTAYPAEECRLKDSYRSKNPSHLNQELIFRKDGTSFIAELWSHPIAGAESPLGGVLTYFDITTQKNLERQLYQSQKMEAIGQLTGGIAHDFNNLLAVIIGNLELLEDESLANTGSADLVDRALSAGLRGAQLTQQLLSFSRNQSLQPDKVNVDDMFNEVVKLAERTLRENIEIRTAISPEVGAILIDPAQFQSALLNLAVNARDAMPDGGQLTFAADNETVIEGDDNQDAAPGDYVVVAVSDTGTGIPEDKIERIFEPFFTTKETGKGTGLGLSMVYGFIRQSNGFTRIESRLGVGTTIRLYLPVQSNERAKHLAHEDTSVAPAGINATVLVVDDNADVRGTGVSILGLLGYRTIEAENAAQALAIMEDREDIDLLFTDIVMPGGMNGVELAEKARTMRPGLKIVLCSGYNDSVADDGTDIPGDTIFIRKPYRKADLSKKLQQILAN